MSEIYGKTKHFTYFSQHEESVISEMITFYLNNNIFVYNTDGSYTNVLKYYKETAEMLNKEIDDSPCFCGTCRNYREHPEYFKFIEEIENANPTQTPENPAD